MESGPVILPDEMGRRRWQQPKPVKRDGSWTLRYRVYPPDAKPIRKRTVLGEVRTMTKREAERAAVELLARVNGGNAVGSPLITLQGFIERHWEPHHVSTLSAGTQGKYRSHVRNHILPALGSRRLDRITPEHIQVLLNRMTASWATKCDVRTVISSVYTKAMQWGYVEATRNPAKNVNIGRKKAAREKAILTHEQFDLLVQNLPEPSRSLVLLLDATGLRVSEALGLQWKHIDSPVKGWLRVEQRWYRGSLDVCKTERSARVVSYDTQREVDGAGGALSSLQAASAAATRLAPGDPNTFVFDRGDGEPYDDRELSKDQLRPALRALKLWKPGMGWHALRRKFATEIQAAGASDIETARALGHTRTSMTAEYTVMDIERLREIGEKRRRSQAVARS